MLLHLAYAGVEAERLCVVDEGLFRIIRGLSEAGECEVETIDLLLVGLDREMGFQSEHLAGRLHVVGVSVEERDGDADTVLLRGAFRPHETFEDGPHRGKLPALAKGRKQLVRTFAQAVCLSQQQVAQSQPDLGAGLEIAFQSDPLAEKRLEILGLLELDEDRLVLVEHR